MHDDLAEYKKINRVFCPYFNEYVYYTRLGYEHIKYKRKNRARNIKDRNMRMKLIPTSVKLINLSSTLQDATVRNSFEERKINSRVEIAMRSTRYYEFMAIIDNSKIKVIVKELNNIKIFLSVIPIFNKKIPPAFGDNFY